MVEAMNFRSGIYFVSTDRWYIERTVWLIAGLFILLATTLAALHQPLWVLLVIVTALVSINVSLTGFGPVGNVLQLLGFTPMLGRSDPTVGDRYFMQTDSWYLERRIYMGVGINLTVASVLSLVHSAWWLLFPAFVGVAMLVFATTGFCIMANSLYWLGAEPRLAPECDRTCDSVLGATDHASAR
jgi:hypothetical protein